MNKVFKEEIGDTFEVYIDDIFVKFSEEKLHDKHLTLIFQIVRQYNMRLNLEKRAFGVRTKKNWGFYLAGKGIEDIPYKCEAVIWMVAPLKKR